MADNSQQKEIADVIVIGSGPAGYTAAIYAARAGLKPLVFEGFEAGGLLTQTTMVENFPGFREGIMGPELMDEMRAQSETFGADLRPQNVDEVDLTGDVKKVWSEGEEYHAKTVILAMGSKPRYLDIPGEEEFKARGVSACATCDGFFFRDKDIAVVGGGDSAMEEANFLTRFAKSVTIIHRRDEWRASPIMAKRAAENEKIKFLMNSIVTEIQGDNSVNNLRIKNTVTGEMSDLPVEGVFMSIGHDPQSEMLKGQLETDEKGYVKVANRTSVTSLDGVFAAGDLIDPKYQQAVTAAGSGCVAALDAQDWLMQHED
ncbi:MAG TPA: thioredoxin-disulfide reductase [Corynebacteriales bacterium]|nr:thioredoxin-disulfide reductase [Mycobacteriales bacterium]